MSLILSLPGSVALSPFRIEKIRAQAAELGLSLGTVSTRYWHFLELDSALIEAELDRVTRMLDAGPAGGDALNSDISLLVTPRPGTISPWSSKASEILKNCGIAKLLRIERGVAYRVHDADGVLLSPESLTNIQPQK